MPFRITTWNVNGIRNPFGYQPWREKRSFQAMFDILESDIVIMQETKIQRKDLQDDMVLVPGWDVFFSLPKHKKGYSGVAIYTRNVTCAAIRAEEGVTGALMSPKSTIRFRDLPQEQQIGGYPRPGQLEGIVDEVTLDSEGRCVILEFPAFVLFGVYSPANRDESRDEFRLGFLQALDVRIRNLVAEGKQVILTGDLNITRSDIDSTNVTEMLLKEGLSTADWMSMPARRLFNQLIFEGTVYGPRDAGRERPVLWDLCRGFHPEREGMNTCWDTKRNTRPANNGSRIDYILCSDGIKDWFTFANIQEGLMGSDHCPVFATLADKLTVKGKEYTLLELLNAQGTYQGDRRLREWGPKDLLPLSARLIPEFDRRQSIRDMFTKKPDSNSSEQGSKHKVVTENPHPQPTTKRPIATRESVPDRALKRTKASSKSVDPKNKVATGQRTLQGFFKPKTPAPQPEAPSVGGTGRATLSPTTTTSLGSPNGVSSQWLPPQQPETFSKESLSTTVEAGLSDRVFDPIEAKESWSRLLRKRVAPRCEHHELCISLTTKKPGVNCGRSFYICPRPLGPSGEKEKESEWRCGTFIWSSDWNSAASG
ncbi:DNA lyase [Dactylonectria estremocensis]|uniref:DNA-(apurinic or apyrimidinic site) endonuclease 2 n=1 Tax=Dactylonectria estremocensis TaxID=1079267 RepID=A0A9P9FDK2_9HYPO|nr:DNA lyase [Dactylonectria estremocensis]